VLFETEEQLLKVQKALNEQQIFPRRYFYPSLNTIDFVKGQTMSISEDVASRVLCLPLYAGLLEPEINQIINLINKSL
jgi:dTDP-4-amino-4,6-dideoxygalactose transaminase